MTDKIEFDGAKLDPAFARTCAIKAEEALYDYVNDPASNSTLVSTLAMFLNRVSLMRGLLKGVIDIHNGIVAAHRSSEDPEKATDVSDQLHQLALLATGCAVNFGDEIGHIVVKFKPETGDIEFDNVAGKGSSTSSAPRPENPVYEDSLDEAISPLLAAHDKGLH